MTTFASQTKALNQQSSVREGLDSEERASLALLPITATLLFYLLPDTLQQQTIIQFLPQVLAYVGFGMWMWNNTNLRKRLGIQSIQLWDGVKYGGLVGIGLGVCNTAIILKVIPALNGDITFLTLTPHAQVPTFLMVPWVITAIAIAVEFNFRGFLLGRLIHLLSFGPKATGSSKDFLPSSSQLIAIISSALVFAFDPFMVATFKHLHWIAVWDGLVWGWLWVRFQNLYMVITAHAVEVMVLYTCMKIALT